MAGAEIVATLRRLATSFIDDECPFYAGAVAYQIFFAILPMILLIVGVLAFFLEGEQLRAQATRLLGQVIPAGTAARLIEDLIEARALSLGLGVVGTLWGVTAIHAALDRGMQAVFGRATELPLVRGKLAGLLFATLLIALGLISFAFSFVMQALAHWMEAFGLGVAQRLTLQLLSPLYGLIIGFVFFLVIYRAIPRKSIPWRSLLVGAGLAALLWEGAKIAFAIWTRELGAFSSFGPLALAAGLLTWIYLTALIVLFGAEVIKTRMQAAP